MPTPPSIETPVAASALSGHLDTRTAATEVAHMLHDAIGERADLVTVFASFHHRAALAESMETVRTTLMPANLMAVTTESVVGDDDELEGLAGMSAVAMRLPGVRLHPWHSTPSDPIPVTDSIAAAERIGLTDDFRASIMLADPFSTPITKLLPALTTCGGTQPVPIVGGMASGSNQQGQNVLIINEMVAQQGAIGMSLSGDVELSFVVSQGCRPIGGPLVVTRCDRNILTELGGRPALAVMQDVTGTLPEHERPLLQKGLLLGAAINESKRPLGRGDFLVRNLLGFDQEKNAIVTGEMLRLGQTVQFHVRDAQTAAEDLQLLLDAQQLSESPFAAMLFTCNGRGKRLFNQPNHDITIIRDRLGAIPIAGFFAAGELGPIGDRSFLHGHTASLALFRSR